MSAPRKIWMARRCADLVDYPLHDDEHLYHHDEVVRELVDALEKAEMMMRMRGHLEMANECAAALAKIAQDA